MDNKKFWIINSLALGGGALFIAISLFLSPIFTRLFYPSIYEAAKTYIFAANLAATISVVCNLTQASVLKFAPTWLQIVKEAIYAIVYLLSGISLMEKYGLMGFCIAAIIANTSKLIVLYILGAISLKAAKV